MLWIAKKKRLISVEKKSNSPCFLFLFKSYTRSSEEQTKNFGDSPTTVLERSR
jgi:hypothetical protein